MAWDRRDGEAVMPDVLHRLSAAGTAASSHCRPSPCGQKQLDADGPHLPQVHSPRARATRQFLERLRVPRLVGPAELRSNAEGIQII